MKYRRPRGLQDILPDKVAQWRLAEGTFREVCRRYRYEEIRTPIFEETELFTRAVGEETDIVSKEMYTFEDRSGHSLTLRAEGTAPTIRAYLENNLRGQDRERLVRLFYIGPIFRYDRPQAGRYRQHHQCGLEALGSANPAVDAEVIDLALSFYAALGIKNVELRLNSVGCPQCAPEYTKALQDHVRPRLEEMCEDCRRRFDANPLRMLDCKVERCREITDGAPKMTDVLCEDCAQHFAAVQRHLDTLGIAFTLDPRIVRGLDYYTKTAFEFKVSVGLGAQDVIGGGGRYDGLVEQCGGPATPGVGIGMGLERILLVREALGLLAEEDLRHGVLVVTLGDAAWEAGVRLVSELRDADIEADLDYRQRSMKSQLRFADNERFAQAVIVGEDELARGVVALRDLATSEQQEVARNQLLAALTDR
jgi:histidyl-tRNA synthetase